MAVFLLSFAVSGKPLTCAIFWLCFRWMNGKTGPVSKFLPGWQAWMGVVLELTKNHLISYRKILPSKVKMIPNA
ncbi:MAG TPA: hypothetical protein DIC22_08780 [Chitinophagaceae bacterium]|jgi:hypothetical protein|nr:hypothetical protein [Chitinophagaceae bacterium]